MMSIQGDRVEIQGGNLAQKKATTEIVRDLGARLVKDHTTSLQDATDVADQLGIRRPRQAVAVAAVAAASGGAVPGLGL
jgi:hypothetical protein